MDELQQALAALGLTWADVWRLTADRRAGTLVVVALDGRKLVGEMAAGHRQAPRGVREAAGK